MRYYFDLFDGHEIYAAEDGNDLPDEFEARLVAVRYLLETAVDLLPKTTVEGTLWVKVRDGNRPVLELSLTFAERRFA